MGSYWSVRLERFGGSAPTRDQGCKTSFKSINWNDISEGPAIGSLANRARDTHGTVGVRVGVVERSNQWLAESVSDQ